MSSFYPLKSSILDFKVHQCLTCLPWRVCQALPCFLTIEYKQVESCLIHKVLLNLSKIFEVFVILDETSIIILPFFRFLMNVENSLIFMENQFSQEKAHSLQIMMHFSSKTQVRQLKKDVFKDF